MSIEFLRGWSLDAVRVGSIGFAGEYRRRDFSMGNGMALYPRPNINPGVPLELYGSVYPGGKIFNRAAFTAPPPGNRAIWAAMCCGASMRRKPISECNGIFVSPKTPGLVSAAEAFNILNHANFGNPMNRLTGALFGHSTQTLANAWVPVARTAALIRCIRLGGRARFSWR